jgi:hypothetical protein
MTSQTTIKRTAADKREGMTLDELSDFLDETERAGVTTGLSPAVSIGMGGQIKWIAVTG